MRVEASGHEGDLDDDVEESYGERHHDTESPSKRKAGPKKICHARRGRAWKFLCRVSVFRDMNREKHSDCKKQCATSGSFRRRRL